MLQPMCDDPDCAGSMGDAYRCVDHTVGAPVKLSPHEESQT